MAFLLLWFGDYSSHVPLRAPCTSDLVWHCSFFPRSVGFLLFSVVSFVAGVPDVVGQIFEQAHFDLAQPHSGLSIVMSPGAWQAVLSLALIDS